MEKKIPSRIKRKRSIKFKKSTLGVFVAFVASVFSMFYVFAGENNKVTISKIEDAHRGDEIVVDVDLDCVKEYNSAYVKVEFDSDVLEYVGAG